MEISTSNGDILYNPKDSSYPNITKIVTHRAKPTEDGNDQIMNLLISENDYKYYIYHNTSEIKNTQDLDMHGIYLHRISDDKRSINGYKLEDGKLVNAWDITFPENEVVIRVEHSVKKSEF